MTENETSIIINENTNTQINAQQSIDDPTKLYTLFRKCFHIPMYWMHVQNFIDLVQHRYATSQHKDIFVFIDKRLKEMGYGEDNDTMVHDYLYFMLIDLLTLEEVPFITEQDVRNTPELFNLLGGKIPDLIIKNDINRRGEYRDKTLILDVFV